MEEKEFSLSGSPTAFPETESPTAIHFGGGASVPQETSMNFNTTTGIAAAAAAAVGGGGGSVPQETSTTFNTSAGIAAAGGGGCRGGGGSDGVLGKKKRGRPRKYDSDGNLRVPAKSPQPTGFFLSPPPPSDFSGKRGRGRPAGSGNWQLLASLGGLFANTAGGDFTPHVVTVYTGEDVAAKILSFSAKGPRGICVLSANGAVSNVTIRQPGSCGGLLTYEGRFEILSLTGSFTVSENGGVRSRIGGLSVSLAGPDGRVVGGGIAGLLTAASPIQIVVGSFMPNGFKVHKRKHHLEPRTAPDTVTEAMPISQAAPGANISVTPTSQLPSENHEEADNNTSNEQHPNGTSPDSGEWNGSEPASAQRPYPDINISVSLE